MTITTPPPPIQLEPLPGPRTVVVDYEKAVELVKLWKEQLLEQFTKVLQVAFNNNNNNNNSPLILCDRIRLSNKSYTAEAAQVIASFIKEPFFNDFPPLANGIIEVDLSDIIASRMTEEGLLVLRTFCDAFANSSKLANVNLSHNAIGEQAIGCCETILTKKSLKRLSFDNAGLANETMATLASVLTEGDESGTRCIASNLTALHFSRNMSGAEGCEPFSRIFEKCTRIQDLRFAANRTGGDGSDIIASVLDASLSKGHNPNLWKLELQDNFFKSKASHDALSRALVSAKSLTYLDLGGCELEDDGIKKVCNALLACHLPLDHLDLSGNDATRHGARYIAHYIGNCGGNLKTLRLEDNMELTSKGVASIASAFHGSGYGHSIEEIQMNNCSVGAIGAQALIDAFCSASMPKLKIIALDGNSFAGDVLIKLNVAFGYRLGKIDNNNLDGDADDDLLDDEEEEGEEEWDGEPVAGVRHVLRELNLSSQNLPPKLVAGVFGNDPTIQTECTAQFRRLLSIEENPPIKPVIESGVVSRFFEFLQQDDLPALQVEAAGALTWIASGTSEHTKMLMEIGVVPNFVLLLQQSSSDHVRELAVRALGGIAGNSLACRDFVLHAGAMQLVLQQLNFGSKLSMLRAATWTVSNFCRGIPHPDFELVCHSLRTLTNLIVYFHDEEVLSGACHAFSYFPAEKILAVIDADAGVCLRLVELLRNTSPNVQSPALRVVGNLVAAGDDRQTQMIINRSALPYLLSLLSSPVKIIRKDACWTISNIMVGNMDHIQSVIDNDIVPSLIRLFVNEEFYVIRKEAAWAISNAASSGSPQQIVFLVQQGCVQPLCNWLLVDNEKLVLNILEGLEKILNVGKDVANATGTRNQMTILVAEAGGLDKIQDLQNHSNNDIYEKCVTILESNEW